MSLTTAKHTAFQYSGASKERGTVFEVQAGRVDIGASISFLSQYPGEEEYLMPPLSCLEVFTSLAFLARAPHPLSCVLSSKADSDAVNGRCADSPGSSTRIRERSDPHRL